MLGFVNGRSCAHKSKPRGLILCFMISGAKVLLFIFSLHLSATFCAFSLRFFAIKYFTPLSNQNKKHPTSFEIECKSSEIFLHIYLLLLLVNICQHYFLFINNCQHCILESSSPSGYKGAFFWSAFTPYPYYFPNNLRRFIHW